MSQPQDYKTVIEQHEPEFIHYVEEAIQSNSAVVLKIEGFQNSKDIVWACLRYAFEKGVLVTIVPPVLKHPVSGLTPISEASLKSNNEA